MFSENSEKKSTISENISKIEDMERRRQPDNLQADVLLGEIAGKKTYQEKSLHRPHSKGEGLQEKTIPSFRFIVISSGTGVSDATPGLY